MKAYIDALSSGLVERYKLYISTFHLDVDSEEMVLEFRFGYTLRADARLQSRIFKIGVRQRLDDSDLRSIIKALFSEIETQIDESIARTLVELN